MFDIAPTELLLCAIVALVVIGPKDLPKAMRVVGHWVGRARGMARQFRSGFDAMVREAELEEMERKWAAENERIMREHPAEPAVAEEPATPASANLVQPTTPVEPTGPVEPASPVESAPPVVSAASEPATEAESPATDAPRKRSGRQLDLGLGGKPGDEQG
jgi:sec-independent protein translocase protein TatB